MPAVETSTPREVVALRPTWHDMRMGALLCPLLDWLLLPDEALTNWMSTLTTAHPLANTHLFRCPSHASTPTTDDQITRSVLGVRKHAFDDAGVDLRIGRDIARLALGQWPPDGLPRPIFTEIHTSEGQVLHDVPGNSAHPRSTIIELQHVVHATLCCRVVELSMERRVWISMMVGQRILVVDEITGAPVHVVIKNW